MSDDTVTKDADKPFIAAEKHGRIQQSVDRDSTPEKQEAEQERRESVGPNDSGYNKVK